MSKIVIDIMAVSLTVNWCVLCFNVVPILRIQALRSVTLRRCRILTKLCRHYAERPLTLARIVTEQLTVWILVLLSLVAICTTDVIKYPFRTELSNTTKFYFINTLFAINIGRHVFTVVQRTFMTRQLQSFQYKFELIQQLVTIVYYVLFLAYRQNMLLGLVGILVESTSIFDEVGRYYKDRDRRNTLRFRRLVVIGCVCTMCFRGVVPTAFLVIAMFQQTPFSMDYIPLSVFFLGIVVFSVANVWQILTNIQRFIKHVYYRSRETCHTSRLATGSISGQVVQGQQRESRLQVAKNNLGYLKPYDNKNIAFNVDDEKHNLNNKKEFSKETAELVDPIVRFSFAKSSSEKGIEEDLTNRDSHHDLHESSSSSISQIFEPLRVSSSSTESNNSSVIFLPSTNAVLNNNNNFQSFLNPSPTATQSDVTVTSFDDVRDLCQSSAGVEET